MWLICENFARQLDCRDFAFEILLPHLAKLQWKVFSVSLGFHSHSVSFKALSQYPHFCPCAPQLWFHAKGRKTVGCPNSLVLFTRGAVWCPEGALHTRRNQISLCWRLSPRAPLVLWRFEQLANGLLSGRFGAEKSDTLEKKIPFKCRRRIF